MNVSYALVRLSAWDILGIIEEFVSIDGLKIEAVDIKNVITIKGRYTKKIGVNFSITLGVGAVKEDEVIVKILKFKVGCLRVVISLIHIIFKKLLSSFENYGIVVKEKHLIINIKKIQDLIPVTTFSIKNIVVKDRFIECEGENIAINLKKEYKSISKVKEEYDKEKYQKKLIINDTYVKLRANITERMPEKIKEISPYILLIPDFLTLIIRLFKDKRVHLKEKIFLGAVMGYLLLPIDFVPDFIPVIGSIDDVYIIFYAVEKIVKNIPRDVVIENYGGDPEIILSLSKVMKNMVEALGIENSENLTRLVIKKIFSKNKKKQEKNNGKSICCKKR